MIFGLQNGVKIEEKTFKIRCWKIIPFRIRFFQFFTNFWRAQSLPKSTQNRKKTLKNRCLKNSCFSTTFFLDLAWFWTPKTMPKSRFFRCFFENVDFVKIIVFPKRNCYFSGFDPPKIDQKSMPKLTRKKHRKKTSQKPILASILASKLEPSWFKIEKNLVWVCSECGLWSLLKLKVFKSL